MLPVVTGAASVVATGGFMAMLGYDLNPLSIILPSLLMVVGSTKDIHILSDCLGGQACCHGLRSRMMALSMVKSLRMQATMATVAGFPAALSLS